MDKLLAPRRRPWSYHPRPSFSFGISPLGAVPPFHIPERERTGLAIGRPPRIYCSTMQESYDDDNQRTFRNRPSIRPSVYPCVRRRRLLPLYCLCRPVVVVVVVVVSPPLVESAGVSSVVCVKKPLETLPSRSVSL